jgi:DNA invertase Pin-like site-specific DNA recombinase
MSRPWLGYHRISRVGDRVDTPVSETQFERTVRDYAERKGLLLEMLPVEKNVSGGEMQRPILGAALERVERGEAAGIVVAMYDRLSRAELVDALTTIRQIERAGGQAVSVREDFDLSTPEGRQARNMSFVMSSADLDRKKLYIRASKKSAVERGVWPFSKVPIGYLCTRRKHGGDGKLDPDPETAPKVVAAFESRARGESWTQIANRLGVGFSHAGRIVKNPIYRGEIRLRMSDGEEFINPKAHTPLVDRATWEAAQLDYPRPARKGNHRALLAGLVRCAGCGGSMSPNTDTKGGLNYRCAAQPRTTGRCKSPAIISRAKLEAYVVSVVLPYLAEGQVKARTKVDQLQALAATLGEAEAERDLYAEVTRVADIGKEAFIAGMKLRQEAVENAAADLARAKAQLPAIPGQANVAELWQKWTTEQRRLVLSGALEGILVWKGRAAAANRVRIVARGFKLPGGPVARKADLEGKIGALGLE